MRLVPPSKLEQARIYQKIRVVIFKPEFQIQIDKIRSDFNIQFLKNTNRLYHVTSKAFDLRVNKIREKFNLHSGWFGMIKQYVITNSLLDDPDAPILNYISPGKVSSIEIFPNTELWDIKNAIKLFKSKDIGKRFKPWANIERDHDIYELARIGKSIADVHREVLKKYNQNISYGSIKTALSKFQQRMDIPDKYRVKNFKTRSYS